MLANIQVQEPQELAEVLEALLGDLIARGEINLMLNLGQPNLWMIQGRRVGSFEGLPKYGQSDIFPTYRGEPSVITGCEVGICTANFRPDTDDNAVSLFIRDAAVDEESQACKYQILNLIDVSILAAVNVQKQMGVVGEQQPGASLTIRGTLRQSAARLFEVRSNETLLDTLENLSVTPNADTVGDGVNDGWEFVFQGAASAIYFAEDPTSNEEARPDNCEMESP
jgi:hypothetical protein